LLYMNISDTEAMRPLRPIVSLRRLPVDSRLETSILNLINAATSQKRSLGGQGIQICDHSTALPHELQTVAKAISLQPCKPKVMRASGMYTDMCGCVKRRHLAHHYCTPVLISMRKTIWCLGGGGCMVLLYVKIYEWWCDEGVHIVRMCCETCFVRRE
jgi:hypothetical protein